MKPIKKIIAILMTLMLVSGSHAQAATAKGWFFTPNSEHLQPQVYGGDKSIDEYGCIYLGDKDEKVIYLTFDAGYENGNVEKTLDILNRQQVQGTFFILPHMCRNYTDLVKRMHDEGHIVGNHTYSHKNVSGMTFEQFENEITSLEKLYYETTGNTLTRFFRPPEGAFSKNTLEYCKKMSVIPVFWSFAYADWDNNNQMSPEKAKAKILQNVHNGMVMLLHPTSDTNAAILEDVIITLKEQGYRFSTVDEIAADRRAGELDYYYENGMVFSGSSTATDMVALTFDDGPDSLQTPQILDVLAKYNAKATFFVVGKNIEGNEEVIRRIIDEGHEIGNHTYSHSYSLKSDSSLLIREITETENILESAFGYSPVLFRPPGGNISESMIKSVCDAGYTCVLWSWRMDTRDWASPPADEVIKTVLDGVDNGNIVLFHDKVYGKSPTAQALDKIIPILMERGYSLATVSELMSV